jgi:choline kinase
MKRAIILAAGKGTRLVKGFDFPKPLKRVAGVPLIVRVLRSLEKAGVDEAVVVVGYLADTLVQGIRRYPLQMSVKFVMNEEYEKPNGTSLLKAAAFVDGPTFLMMSDHLWSQELFHAVDRFPLASDEAVLGIDFGIERCFDLDDATKVQVSGDRVAKIGKELLSYDALDTGVFRITPALIQALRAVEGSAGCSLSQGVAALAAAGKLRVADVGDATWIDVDTPEAHAPAERLLRRYGTRLAPAPESAAATALVGA